MNNNLLVIFPDRRGAYYAPPVFYALNKKLLNRPPILKLASVSKLLEMREKERIIEQ